MERFMQLQEMGREPISLPDKIYFAGNVTAQKTPGNHHLPQFRKTGTYNHPALRAQRKREAMDFAKRLLNGKLTEVTLRKIGGIKGLQDRLEEFNFKIDEEQMQIALMNAESLEQEGQAKKQMREEQKILEMARIGIKYEPLTEEKAAFTPKAQIAAIQRSQKTKVSADEDLSSLRDEAEKDGNNLGRADSMEIAENTGIVDTGDDVDVKFQDTI
jgi:hypothetical protein